MTETHFPLPFRYPGGKHYAQRILRPFWQAVDHDEYREPLVGGGSVFFNKAKVAYNWLNDIDDELMTTYRVMSDPDLREKLIELVSAEVASKDRWKEVFALVPQNALEVAYKFFYLNRTSFSGKMVSAAWGYRPRRSLPPQRWQERIRAAGQKLRGVKLTALDFEPVIHAPSRGKQTLIYVDPPYFRPPKKKHYRHGFERADHDRLCKALRATQHKFFLTYDDMPEARSLYAWANIREVEFFYRVGDSSVRGGSRKLGFELVITNYELPRQPRLIRQRRS